VKRIVLSLLITIIFFSLISGKKAIPESISVAPFSKIYINKQPDIPYILTREKTNTENGPIALMLSGDGGWFSFEKSIAEKLATYGITTIGIDTRKYFWTRKTPEETTIDMAALLSYYGKESGKTKFLLIGYSLGAELVPFVANRLPDVIKSNIVSVVMLSPEATTDFEIHLSNMLGMGNKRNTYDVIEEITRMKDIPALCIFGEGEKSSVPGLLKNTSVKIAIIPGDHHFKSNETLIVQTMKNKNAF
jgi:type IV secretory pathway VirJ component